MKKNKIYIKSYGCQMNVYDSNRILDLFKNKNYEVVDDPKNANLIVLNTCHIREKAAEKVYSDIGRINKIKKNTNKDNYKLVVAGCVAQAEGKEVKSRAPSVDFVVGPQAYHQLPNMLETKDNMPGARANEVFARCYDAGVLVRVTGDTIALSPPLIIEKNEINQLFETIGEVLNKVE